MGGGNGENMGVGRKGRYNNGRGIYTKLAAADKIKVQAGGQRTMNFNHSNAPVTCC